MTKDMVKNRYSLILLLTNDVVIKNICISLHTILHINKNHDMKKAFATIALCVATTLGCTAQSLYVRSNEGSVNLRTAPSKTAAKAGILSQSFLVPCIEELDGWYKVNVNGKEAYVSQEVASTCDAVIPEEMFGKELTSNAPLDKIRHQGSILIEAVDKEHALITTTWMRVNLPAETTCYLAYRKDGELVATHGAGTWIDASSPLSDIMEEMSPLDTVMPVGFDEFNNTIYFDTEYSEFE